MWAGDALNLRPPPQTGNIAPLLSNITGSKALLLLNNQSNTRKMTGMRHTLSPFALAAWFTVALAAGLLPAPAARAADCYADYKAKQDNPLRLHYGVIQLRQACAKGPARTEIAARLKQNGWTLLNVLSVFGPEGLEKRRGDAGSFYLRF